MKHTLLLICSLSLTTLTGCVSLSDRHATSHAQVIIEQPLAVNPQSELALARLTEILATADLAQEQRAQLLYDRGVIYDSVGLRGLASYDFQRALRLQPDFVDAYNFVGIHLTQRQDFLQAYEAFDAAIELNVDHEYAYLNRGIALYYGKRPEQALNDLQRFQLEQQNDPYRIAWLYLVEHDIDPLSAQKNLRQTLATIEHDSWANNILRLFVGDISEQQFIASISVDVTDRKMLLDRLCEAYFYLGKYNQLNDDMNTSRDYFKLALTTNVYEFIEHRYAELELDLLELEQR